MPPLISLAGMLEVRGKSKKCIETSSQKNTFIYTYIVQYQKELQFLKVCV